MTNTYYAIKIDGRYMVYANETDKQMKINSTTNIKKAHLCRLEDRNSMIFELASKLEDIDKIKITSERIEMESEIDETAEDQVIKFDNGLFLACVHSEGILTTKNLDLAALFAKEEANLIRAFLKTLSDNEMLSDNLKGDITLVPVKRTYISITEI